MYNCEAPQLMPSCCKVGTLFRVSASNARQLSKYEVCLLDNEVPSIADGSQVHTTWRSKHHYTQAGICRQFRKKYGNTLQKYSYSSFCLTICEQRSVSVHHFGN